MDSVQTTVDPLDLVRRVSELIDAGQIGAARPLLAAVRQIGAPATGLAQLAARLAQRDGSLEEALTELDGAIGQDPDHPGLRKCRAELRHRLGDLDGATRDAAEAVIADSRDPVAKAMLGTLMLELDRPTDAFSCLKEAVAARPADPAFREALATAQERCRDVESALQTLEHGIELAPTSVSLRNAAVMLCIRRRDFTGAVRLAEEARAVGIADACLFGLKGHALSSLGRHDEAADSYQEALKLGPDDPYVRHLVSATGALPRARCAPEAYLRAVFDGYADRFEMHLISLGYRIPVVIRNVLMDHPAVRAGQTLGSVLDLGCGTGLVALAIGDLPLGPITGVDIAPRMLEHARIKGLYADLREADVMAVLMSDTARWPLILAADVLCYFGALDEVLSAAHSRLEPNGWFIFSLETLLPDHDGVLHGNGEWVLQRQGRYAHTTAYAQQAALWAGFLLRRVSNEVIRYEGGAPVEGILMVLERSRHDG